MSEAEATTGPFRIVILDDSSSTRGLSKSALERNLDCEVSLYQSADTMFEALGETLPDLFLIDVAPGQDSGVTVCERLKSAEGTAGIPIVFLSAYKEPTKRVMALNAGGADYIDKPFYPEELVARVRHHAEMHRLRLEKQSQIQEQQALLRVLCHDLVNPIFGAHSLLQLKHELGKVDERTINMVLSCCKSALDMIEHVRDENRLVKTDKQVVQDEVKEERVALQDAVQESVQTVAVKYQQKKVKLEIDVRRPAILPVERVVLAHNILNNLLTNALKFSYPEKTVTLRSRIEVGEGGKEFCTIEVIDQGIGMPSEILKNVFKEGAKVSRKGTSDEKGTGFGMPLVKRYVEKAGGAVSINSVEGEGTTVRLVFPVVK